ncbi:hypothetical protein HNY73_000181 [Argiope bruennichi]|uniref:Uncharacterized protein n=1 Tax=Argiope bruennichi TaxID=94029 RepID=A0A8T0FX70_ARGBR|nr:hypothetical protein HNY73_000181 [Argiope bruennichi]
MHADFILRTPFRFHLERLKPASKLYFVDLARRFNVSPSCIILVISYLAKNMEKLFDYVNGYICCFIYLLKDDLLRYSLYTMSIDASSNHYPQMCNQDDGDDELIQIFSIVICRCDQKILYRRPPSP